MGPDPDASARESRLMHGVLDMCVLALLDVEPLHAYGVVERLREHGFDNASYGTIYPLVTRLRKQGLVDQRPEPSPAGPPRNVLAINDRGRETLATWVHRWQDTTATVAGVLRAREMAIDVR